MCPTPNLINVICKKRAHGTEHGKTQADTGTVTDTCSDRPWGLAHSRVSVFLAQTHAQIVHVCEHTCVITDGCKELVMDGWMDGWLKEG